MVSCTACDISHKARKKGVSFHRFPKNPAQRCLWLNFVNKDGKDLPKICYLCSQHFNEDDFDRTSKVKVQLRKNAVPTKIVLRSKYSRTEEPVIVMAVVPENKCNASKSTLKNVESGFDDVDDIPMDITSQDSTEQPELLSCTLEITDTPVERKLKEEIRRLVKKDLDKSEQIRRLQKSNWSQKRRILKLNKVIRELRKKNLIL